MRLFNWTALVVSFFVVGFITSIVAIYATAEFNQSSEAVMLCVMYVGVIPLTNAAIGCLVHHLRMSCRWLVPLSLAVPIAVATKDGSTAIEWVIAVTFVLYTVLTGLFGWWLADRI